MKTDLHNLTRDQLERLAGVLLQHATDGDDQQTTLSAAHAILSERLPDPHPWTVREALLCITDVFEAHVREADRRGGGMSVPFHGDFASALRLPSVVGRFRWWARELRAALDSPRTEPARSDTDVATEATVADAIGQWCDDGGRHV